MARQNIVFSSDLGWFGIVTVGTIVLHVSIAHRTEPMALAALHRFLLETGAEPSAPETPSNSWLTTIVERFQAYASGSPEDFRDIPIDLSACTPFQRSVLKACRKIPYGETATYGQLAHRSGSPRAARAVGSVMAGNRVPLIVPCHRVVPTSGALGGFSAPGGIGTKQRLLDLERATIPHDTRLAAHASVRP